MAYNKNFAAKRRPPTVYQPVACRSRAFVQEAPRARRHTLGHVHMRKCGSTMMTKKKLTLLKLASRFS